jgi:solute carrier family 13 (sodium-dependent dicarboxylate transporter), member 2/3/5
MGQVLAATKGLDVAMNLLFGWMKSLMTDVYSSTMALYWCGFLYHLVLGSEISMLGSSMPGLMHFAKAEGMNPLALGMIWTFASGGKIFAYQSAVMIAGYSYGYFGARDLLRIGLALTVAEAVILLALVPYYWPLIGISM